MSQNAKDDMPDPLGGAGNRAAAGQSARRRVLGDQLRAYYDSVASEPVPDTLTELMAELARKSGGKPDLQDAAKPADGSDDSGRTRE
jgi:hypothetical protein